MNALSERALEFLERVYDDDRALFPYSTRLENGALRSVYENPLAVRYSLISLLGLREAAIGAGEHPFVRRLDPIVDRFLAVHAGRVANHADQGLLALLISGNGRDDELGPGVLRRIGDAARADGVKRLTMQDLTWMLWGAVGAARSGLGDGEPVARRIYEVIRAEFVDPRSGLPRHALGPLRRRLVSFGAVTYFLRSVLEYGRAFDDAAALQAFELGVGRILELQGRNGEWPWMIDVGRGVPLDVHPVFSVHQLSMAMLFLHPAADLGLDGAGEAVGRSFVWVRGGNELGVAMVVDGGRFIYRSIERDGRWPRAERYARSMRRSALRRRDSFDRAVPVHVNPESRSYEWGWILFAWAGRPETPAFLSDHPV